MHPGRRSDLFYFIAGVCTCVIKYHATHCNWSTWVWPMKYVGVAYEVRGCGLWSTWVWPMKYVGVAYDNFWRHDIRHLTCAKMSDSSDAAAACSSWVYSIIINFSTRLVYGLRARDHVTDATIKLHWLPMRATINFKLYLLVHQVLKGQSPSYIAELLQSVTTRHPNLWSVDNNALLIPRTSLKIFRSPATSQLSRRNSRLSCLINSMTLQYTRLL